MVMRINTGYSPEYLLKEVATGRENYYTGAVAEGEPPGRWWGAGAEQLGLSGLVEADTMRAVYERFKDPREDGFSDPDRWDTVSTLGHAGRRYATEQDLYEQALAREPDATAERKSEMWTQAGQAARHNVAFFDATFSVQKSITLVHTAFEAREVAARKAGNEEEAAAWGQLRTAVEEAIWEGNNAGLAFLQEHAGYTRVGHHGGAAGQFVDAHDFVVASFFQHDSREGDPQLHIHNGILNRVQGPDGEWRTLDSRGLHRWRPGAAAIAERTTEERFTATVGMLLATRADGKAREVLGVAAETLGLVSNRRHQVTARTAELVGAYEARHGKAPNSYALACMAQEATLATRKAKSHDGTTREQLLDRVEARMRWEIDGGLGAIAAAALAARPEELVPDEWSPREVIALALADVQGSSSGWTRPELMAALNRALPDHLGVADGARIGTLLSTLADEAIGSDQVVTVRSGAGPADTALPDEYRRADGSSVFSPHGAAVYATAEHVHTERALAGAAAVRDGAVMADSSVNRFLAQLEREGTHLGAAQEAAVRGMLTSGARIESLVGPPGTGKSFVVGTMTRAWTDPELTGGPPRRVFGLALSQGAADVLDGNGLIARNTAAWVAIQNRLDAGHPGDGEEQFRLRPTDIVVIDESSMADTPSVHAVAARVHAAGAKLVTAGDPRQHGAIGAGGAMELVADSGAPRYELNEARRFHQEWERDASLRLREGDTAVLDEYYRQGRLVDCGTAAAAEASGTEAWLSDTLAGKRSLLLVDDNETADRLSSQLRARLVELGVVEEHGVQLGKTGAFAGVGDWVETRRIGHELVGYEGNTRAPRTRELFRVVAVRPDGGLEVTTDLHRQDPTAAADGVGATDDGEPVQQMVLSKDYVASDVSLGYAGTSHCGIGATVDTTQSLAGANTGMEAFLVNMTRGKEANTAHFATVIGAKDQADGTGAEQLHRSPRAIAADMMARYEPDLSALAQMREDAEQQESLQAITEVFAEACHRGATARTMTWLDRLNDAGALTAAQRDQLAAEDGAANLTRILRSAEIAGHDPYEVLAEAVGSHSLAGARNLSNVVYSRMRDRHEFTPPADARWVDRVPALDNPGLQHFTWTLAEAADAREDALGAQAAADPPHWATELLGPVPDAESDPTARAAWERKAGLVAGVRESARGTDDPAGDRGPSGRPVEAAELLGPAPKAGRPEVHAAYRAAWDALGRPHAERAELEMSEGQLLARSRAWQRERHAAPEWVADELAGTRHAAAEQRQAAVVRRAEADAARAADPTRAVELQAAAAAAENSADGLDHRVGLLAEADRAYNYWAMHNAELRLHGERADHALSLLNADRPSEPDVTAAAWIAAQEAKARAEEEALRTITEDDLTDQRPDDADQLDAGRSDDQLDDAHSPEGQRCTDARSVDRDTDRDSQAHREDAAPVLETDVPDIRDVAADEPAPREPAHYARIAPLDEAIETNAKARRMLADIAARAAQEADLDTEEDRDVDLSREDPYTASLANDAADNDADDY